MGTVRKIDFARSPTFLRHTLGKNATTPSSEALESAKLDSLSPPVANVISPSALTYFSRL